MKQNYIIELKKALDNVEITSFDGDHFSYDDGILRVFNFLSGIKKNRNGLFICGNGGSAGIAVHMTADFLKNGGYNVRSMFNPSVLTCLGNDLSYDYIFSKQLEMMAVKDDLLVAVSSSGESENIIKAANTMNAIGGEVITFTGFNKENNLRKMGKYNIYVPIGHYGIVESIHNLILQQLVDMTVERDGVALDIEY